MIHDTLRAPVGTKISGEMTFACQQVVNSHHEICGTLVTIPVARLDLMDIQDKLDEEIHYRCFHCRANYLKRIEEDAAIDAQIKEDRS